MIERIEWNRKSSIDELPSPFMRGVGERPLRITLHSESLVNLSGDEEEALELVIELANLPEIEIFRTAPGKFAHILVDEPKTEDDIIPVRLISENAPPLYTGVWNKKQWPQLTASLLSPSKQNDKTISDAQKELVLAQAHHSIGGDILITKSPFLQDNRSCSFISETNPRTPLEAAQLIGLFLRSRENFVYRASSKVRMATNRGSFYWVLTRERIPNMWRYFSACVSAGKERGDDLQYLGEAILVRSARALEARDAIGIEFYKPPASTKGDQIMYHFDYLTLVLAGAIDAQARVASRIYQMNTKEYNASFRNKKFRKTLKESGAHRLNKLSSSEKFISLLTLLYELRNTIHGAALKTFTYQGAHGPQQTLLEIPEPMRQGILSAVDQLGGVDEWGLDTTFNKVWLEPYSYSIALVRETILAIDEIAASTDVRLLFQGDGQPVPALIEGTPSNSIFSWGRRFSFLG